MNLNETIADIIIYHNGACSKSGCAMEILQQSNIAYRTRWYMADPLSRAELVVLLKKLNMQPSEVVRKNEAVYKERYESRQISEGEWLDIITENPILLQRPIIEKGNTAIIARPPEQLLALL